MKGIFSPNPRSSTDLKGLGSGSDLLPACASMAQPPDADVSMDDSHASVMSGVTAESMSIGSPPRTQRRKRNSLGFRSIAGPTISEAGTAPSGGVSVRSRLFPDDTDLKHDNNSRKDSGDPSHSDRGHSSILKPFDLNQEFADVAGPLFDNSNSNSNTTSSSAPDSPPARVRSSSNSQPSTLTPFRPRHAGQATMALRKRQAEQDDLYGKGWSCDVANHEDAFSATESPVDMYTSPRISPSTPSCGNSCSGNSSKSTNRTAVHRSPFYSRHHQQQQQGGRQQLQHHKSPSHFQTLDGRTVQSKNPFSPMIYDETPTPTPCKPLPPGNSPAPGKNGQAATLGLTHPLLLTTDSLSFPASSLNGDDDAAQGKSHLVLRHRLQKRESSPSNNGVGQNINSQKSAAVDGRMNNLGMDMDGLSHDASSSARRSETSNNDRNNSNTNHQIEPKASMYIRDGYPEQSGRYSFTGSPIKENFASADQVHAPIHLPGNFDTTNVPTGKGGEQAPLEQDYCTNIHKVRRRSKGDDVVAAAAQGESSWKKKGMYIKTSDSDGGDDNNDSFHMTFDNESGFYNIPRKTYYYNKQQKLKNEKDSISPTDVFNYPQFRASPSDTSTLPPAPSKPIRRPPTRRYTPIRRTTGPPPTPMPGARQQRSFGFEDANRSSNDNIFDGIDKDGEDSSDDDEGANRISNAQRSRRPKSGIALNTSENTVPPPSRFYSDFDVIAELGSGSFGKVFKTLSRLDGCLYAIKVAHRVAKGVSDRDRMLKEVYALAALSDRADTATFHIVRYHQAWMEEERLYIQTELCTTTLQAEMQQAAPRSLPLATRYRCLREILLALNFIHNNQMVHLDIKPENIFLKNNQFKLGDFGLVSKVSSQDVEEGDSRYMSMELLSGDHADLTKSDIFSLGIAMYEVCLGGDTLPSNGPEWKALRSASIRPPPNTTDDLFQIIKQMMNPAYGKRPCVSDLLKRKVLLSEEQKMMFREREKLLQANQALAAQWKSIPKPKGLVRRNTWSAF